MRFVVYGAGAIGGVVGARLIEQGYEVGLIARGAHGRMIAEHGLRLESPTGSATLNPAVVAERPQEIEWRDDDVVLLAVKSQDTPGAMTDLAGCAPPTVAIACLQNGVANERMALRFFANVYGVKVVCPATHLEPGEVIAHGFPIAGIFDVGRYPSGRDEVADALGDAFNASSMASIVRPDIMRWKYAKLVHMNLSNAVDALCGGHARQGAVTALIREEGMAVTRAAGIDVASPDEDTRRVQSEDVPGRARGGSSSWQSLARSAGSIETDYLNGEIVLLGRLHGVPTPVNECVRRLANQAAREKWPPGSVSEPDILQGVQRVE